MCININTFKHYKIKVIANILTITYVKRIRTQPHPLIALTKTNQALLFLIKLYPFYKTNLKFEMRQPNFFVIFRGFSFFIRLPFPYCNFLLTLLNFLQFYALSSDDELKCMETVSKFCLTCDNPECKILSNVNRYPEICAR